MFRITCQVTSNHYVTPMSLVALEALFYIKGQWGEQLGEYWQRMEEYTYLYCNHAY